MTAASLRPSQRSRGGRRLVLDARPSVIVEALGEWISPDVKGSAGRRTPTRHWHFDKRATLRSESSRANRTQVAAMAGGCTLSLQEPGAREGWTHGRGRPSDPGAPPAPPT